ncbi:YnbE family lipoprotein [Sphingomonas naphthae]|uniref:YnbE family lipoprotein n=2 Tax=Sphingomonas naphthae TaxID=1813468 RepID=A0ABY7TFX4_9SPHN|nr:YnbE family lipoprotein [Sphingomonas naphthae]WCT72123.1 YnbE family lipoprotein [Sphingomonas naphthae]
MEIRIGGLGVAAAMIASPLLLAGCISVKAPDKPIEINLNVTIRQEVVVSLRENVKNLDQQYPGVF